MWLTSLEIHLKPDSFLSVIFILYLVAFAYFGMFVSSVLFFFLLVSSPSNLLQLWSEFRHYFLSVSRFAYPVLMTLFLLSVQFPHLLGQFISSHQTSHHQVGGLASTPCHPASMLSRPDKVFCPFSLRVQPLAVPSAANSGHHVTHLPDQFGTVYSSASHHSPPSKTTLQVKPLLQ